MDVIAQIRQDGGEQVVFSPGFSDEGRMEISPAQCRAARGLLDWTQGELAQKVGVALAVGAVDFGRSKVFVAGRYEIRDGNLLKG